ncbi:ABC transporter ATP-binding protein [Bacillaceae bacterium SIJ1]|uniref:ABC transporter ATP-binding protein n=1 Tax=Litoribacterium kuwaitense TaxID=1398745 RepID=UPI0013E9FAB0|nr:ABC transporter ATP-binding protein [Litoribacterium kuwaitense]NGP44003.1 ABC transporter ATP-binding protein [Litoribacterium kuwaitense]
MIEFENVTKVYEGDVKAINDVSFTVPDGQIVILIGPSGCGKTTLLRMVNQLETVTEGAIRIQGNPLSELDKIQMRRKIGYVIQSNGLFPNMTIEENVGIVPDLLGWDRAKKKERYRYLMELIGLHPDEYRKRYPHELSGGQQQRVGVARALAADPPVMLMDEPFGALDPIIRTKLQEEFLQIQKEVKKTILFVSHDIDEAIKMGDQIALLRKGEIQQFDTPVNLLNHPKNHFVQEFVGQDRVLKSMSLYSVADLQKALNLEPLTNKLGEFKEVNNQTSLRVGISALLNQEADYLVVTDEAGEHIGMLTMDLIEQFLHHEIKGKPVA